GCIATLNPSTCPGTTQTNQLGVTPPSQATIKWSIDPTTPCASIVGADNQTSVVVTSSTCCNFTLNVVITNTDGSTTSCQTSAQCVASPPRTLHVCSRNVTIQCSAVSAPATVAATDDCDPNPQVSFLATTSAGTCAQSYTITRIWTATDACSNSS